MKPPVLVYAGLLLAGLLAGVPAPGQAQQSAPPKLEPPAVHEDGLADLRVDWTASDNVEPPVTGYELQYRALGEEEWIGSSQNLTDTGARIGDLLADTVYQVRVRASSAAGDGPWSEPGQGSTALWTSTLRVGSIDDDPEDTRGYWGYQNREYTKFGGLEPASFSLDGVEYELIVLAWFRGRRQAADGTLQTSALDLYALANAIPDDWIVRIETSRFNTNDGHRTTFENYFEGRRAHKIDWPNPDIDLELGGRYTVAVSRTSSARPLPGAPLTAAFFKVPAAHDGATAFTVDLRFSEGVTVNQADLNAGLLTVTGATVTGTRRLNSLGNVVWRIELLPVLGEDVVLTVPAHRACDAPVTVCTPDGRPLSRPATLTVPGPARPRIVGATSLEVAENDTAVATLTAADDDTDAGQLAWSIPAGAAGGADGDRFTIGRSGQLALRSAGDFENPGDANGDGVYEVTVRVSDGTFSATAALSVTVSDRNEAPTANAGPDQSGLGERATVRLPGAGTDPDAGDRLRYRWSQRAGPPVRLSDADEAIASFLAPGDLPADTTLTFTLRVTDAGGLYGEDDVLVTVLADPPQLPAPAPAGLSAREDGADALSVSWDPPADDYLPLTGYMVQYRESGDGDWIDVAGDAAHPGVQLDGLSRDTAYQLRVRADNAAGEGAWSRPAEGYTALWEATLTAGEHRADDESSAYLGYQRWATEANSFGNLDPATFVHNGRTYEIFILAWYRDARPSHLPPHSSTLEMYSLRHALPNAWAVRVQQARFPVRDAYRTTFLTYPGYTGKAEKYVWLDPGFNLELAGQYEVAISRTVTVPPREPPVPQVPPHDPPVPQQNDTDEDSLTGSFGNLPSSHDGSTAFTVDLHFNAEPELSFRDFTRGLIEVDGGTVRGARRLTPGSNAGWRIEILPAGPGDVVIEVPANRACDAAITICTVDGRKLSRPATVTVPGPDTAAQAQGATPSPPEITSGAVLAAAEGATLVANLTASDADTPASGLTWSIGGGEDRGNFTIAATGALAFAAPKDFENPDDADADGAYRVTVEVSDGEASDAMTVTVTLTDVNEPPTAQAGPDRADVPGGATVTLTGTGADPDAGDTLSYAWTQLSGPGVALTDADGPNVAFTAPAGLSETATLTFTLRVSDAAGLYHEDRVAVTVNPAPPVATLAAASATVLEGEAATFSVRLDKPAPRALAVGLNVSDPDLRLSASPPTTVAIAAGDSGATLALATADDAVIDSPGTVTVGLAAGAGYVLGDGTSARVTVSDNDTASFSVAAEPATIEEGGISAIAVSIVNGVTFADERPVTLTLTGLSAEDYTLGAAVLAAGQASATATLTAILDDVKEAPETAKVAVAVGDAAAGSVTVTIEDPGPAPKIAGVAQVGAVLRAVPEPASGHEWLRDGEPIPGANGPFRVLTAEDAGRAVSVRVNARGRWRESDPTMPVWPAPANPPLPEGMQELYAGTITLETYPSPLRPTGYSALAGIGFGAAAPATFPDSGHELRLAVVNTRGEFGLVTAPRIADLGDVEIYWDRYPIGTLVSKRLFDSEWVWVGSTTQPGREYARYDRGASDGVRVALSVRRPVPLATVSADAASVTEGVAAAFSVALDRPAWSDLTVNFSVSQRGDTLSETAPPSVTVAAGESIATLALPTRDNTATGHSGTVTVSLTEGAGYSLGEATTATVTVLDNDTAATGVLAAPAGAGALVQPAIGIAALHRATVVPDRTAMPWAARAGALAESPRVLQTGLPVLPVERGAPLANRTGASQPPSDALTVATAFAASDSDSAPATTPAVEQPPWGERLDRRVIRLGPNAAPSGAWTDGTLMWVISNLRTGQVAVYSLDDGTELPGRGITLGGLGYPAGLWSDRTTLWVADFYGGIFAYDLHGGHRTPVHDFDAALMQAAGNVSPTGLWSDGDIVWAVDYVSYKAFAYRLSDKSRLPAHDVEFEREHGEAIHPFGLWSDGAVMLTANYFNGEIAAFLLLGGARSAAYGIDASTLDIFNPTGLASDGETLWVVDPFAGRLDAFAAPGLKP